MTDAITIRRYDDPTPGGQPLYGIITLRGGRSHTTYLNRQELQDFIRKSHRLLREQGFRYVPGPEKESHEPVTR